MCINEPSSEGPENLAPTWTGIDWSAWRVWGWCPLTGALPDWADIDDRSRIVAMIYQIREDFFAVFGGTFADTPEAANDLTDATDVITREARAVWWRRDQIPRRVLGGISVTRTYPGIADAWRENRENPDSSILEDLCGDAVDEMSNYAEPAERAEIAARWPVHRILAILAIGELAEVLCDMLAGQPSRIEIGGNGRRYGSELLHAVGLLQMAYSLRGGADQRAGEEMRERARRQSASRARTADAEQAGWLRVARELTEHKGFSSLSACAVAVYQEISGRPDADQTILNKIAKALSTDTEIVARCKSRRGRPKAG